LSAGSSKETHVRLGLIGDNILASKAPVLHRLAGDLSGLDITYETLIPRKLGMSFDETFEYCRANGYRGVNVTYPYKEVVTAKVTIDDPFVRGIGAANTVIFEADGPKGFNTDYSGFISGFRNVMAEEPAGRVLMIGAGGVGKAIAFALLKLGLEGLVILDLDMAKAEALADGLRRTAPGIDISVATDAAMAAEGADGLINCTPVGMMGGMTGHEGTPLAAKYMQGAKWAFDAVYTPVDTRFLADAAAEGLVAISGYELFFYQGVDAWRFFVGTPLDLGELRRLLIEADAASGHKPVPR
jgi:shikimate dehydrogenase